MGDVMSKTPPDAPKKAGQQAAADKPEKPRKPKPPTDTELVAMSRINRILAELDPETAARVCRYVGEKAGQRLREHEQKLNEEWVKAINPATVGRPMGVTSARQEHPGNP